MGDAGELYSNCEHDWEVIRVTVNYNGRELGHCENFTVKCKKCKTEKLKNPNG